MVLTAGLAYVAAAGWHFYEHSQRNDPAVVHALIGIAWVALMAGVVLATVLFRRRPDDRATSVQRSASHERSTQVVLVGLGVGVEALLAPRGAEEHRLTVHSLQ